MEGGKITEVKERERECMNGEKKGEVDDWTSGDVGGSGGGGFKVGFWLGGGWREG